MSESRRRWLVVAVWVAAFAVALVADGPAARWVKHATPIDRKSPVKQWIKPAGDFKFIALLIPVLLVAHPARWR